MSALCRYSATTHNVSIAVRASLNKYEESGISAMARLNRAEPGSVRDPIAGFVATAFPSAKTARN